MKIPTLQKALDRGQLEELASVYGGELRMVAAYRAFCHVVNFNPSHEIQSYIGGYAENVPHIFYAISTYLCTA